MKRIASLVRRLFAGTSRGSSEPRERETPGLEEWIGFCDAEMSEVRRENARLREELRVTNTQLKEAWRQIEKSSGRLNGRREARDREIKITATLLPNVKFLRDSNDVVVNGRLKNPEPALLMLRELSTRSGQTRGAQLAAAPDWKEQHFKTGDGDSGRIYFRYSGDHCSVLLSFKADQRRTSDTSRASNRFF